MKHISQDFKNNYYKRLSLNALLLTLFAFSFVACSDDNGLTANSPFGTQYYNQSSGACFNQRFNAGIPGNSRCPYQGQVIDGQLEGFAEFRVDGAVYLDFGLRYNDLCPVGEVPIYESVFGRVQFVGCEYIGDDFFDPTYLTGHHNSSSCAGGYAGDKDCIPGSSRSNNNNFDPRYNNPYYNYR